MTDEKIIDETGMEILDINCGNCMYSNMIPTLGPQGEPMIGQEQMVCMWGPPQMVVLNIPTPGGMQTAIRSQFPPVGPQICCHQHESDPESFDLISGELIGSNEPN